MFCKFKQSEQWRHYERCTFGYRTSPWNKMVAAYCVSFKASLVSINIFSWFYFFIAWKCFSYVLVQSGYFWRMLALVNQSLCAVGMRLFWAEAELERQGRKTRENPHGSSNLCMILEATLTLTAIPTLLGTHGSNISHRLPRAALSLALGTAGRGWTPGLWALFRQMRTQQQHPPSFSSPLALSYTPVKPISNHCIYKTSCWGERLIAIFFFKKARTLLYFYFCKSTQLSRNFGK